MHAYVHTAQSKCSVCVIGTRAYKCAPAWRISNLTRRTHCSYSVPLPYTQVAIPFSKLQNGLTTFDLSGGRTSLLCSLETRPTSQTSGEILPIRARIHTYTNTLPHTHTHTHAHTHTHTHTCAPIPTAHPTAITACRLTVAAIRLHFLAGLLHVGHSVRA